MFISRCFSSARVVAPPKTIFQLPPRVSLSTTRWKSAATNYGPARVWLEPRSASSLANIVLQVSSSSPASAKRQLVCVCVCANYLQAVTTTPKSTNTHTRLRLQSPFPVINSRDINNIHNNTYEPLLQQPGQTLAKPKVRKVAAAAAASRNTTITRQY